MKKTGKKISVTLTIYFTVVFIISFLLLLGCMNNVSSNFLELIESIFYSSN